MLPYKDVLDLWSSTGALTGAADLPSFSRQMNDLTGTDLYSAGLQDSFIKRGSAGLDSLIEATGIPTVTGEAFGGIGKAFGYEDVGRSVGQSLPRGLVNFAPLIAGSLLAPVTGGASLAVGAGLSGALAGAGTYTETGSPALGLLSGAVQAALPGLAELGGQAGLRAVGAPLVSGLVKEGATPEVLQALSGAYSLAKVGQTADKYLADTVGQRVASYIGGQAAALGAFETAGELQSKSQTGEFYNPLDPEHLFASVIGQLPFAAADIPRVLKGGGATSDVAKNFLKSEATATDAAVTLDSLPPLVQPTKLQKQKADVVAGKLDDLIATSKRVDANPSLSPEMRAATVAEAQKAFNESLVVKEPVTEEQQAGTRFGAPVEVKYTNVKPETVDFTGEVLRKNPKGTAALIKVMRGTDPSLDGKEVWVPLASHVTQFDEGTGVFTTLKQVYKEAAPRRSIKEAKAAEASVDTLLEEAKTSKVIAKQEELPLEPTPKPTSVELDQKVSELDAEQQKLKESQSTPTDTIEQATEKIKTADELNKKLGGDPSTDKALTESLIDSLVDEKDLSKATQKVVNKTQNKVDKNVSIKKAVTTRQANAAKRTENDMIWLSSQVDASTKHPDEAVRKQTKEEIGVLTKFQKDNSQILVGANKKEDITPVMARVYHNWVDKGRQGGLDALRGILKRRADELQTAVPLETLGLKPDGTFSKDANVVNKKHSLNDAQELVVKLTEQNKEPSVTYETVKKGTGYDVVKKTWPTEVSLDKQVLGEEGKSTGTAGEKALAKEQVAALASTSRESSEGGKFARSAVEQLKEHINLLDDTELEDEFSLFGPGMLDQFKKRFGVFVDTLKDQNPRGDYLNSKLAEVGLAFKTDTEAQKFIGKGEKVVKMIMGVLKDVGDYESLPQGPHPDGPINVAPRGKGKAAVYREYGLDQPTPRKTMEYIALDEDFLGSVGKDIVQRFGPELDAMGLGSDLVEEGKRSSLGAFYSKGFHSVFINGRAIPSKDAPPAAFRQLKMDIVHEVVHGITTKLLDDPARKTDVLYLDSLRQRAIEKLPGHIREALLESQRSGQYELYAKNEIPIMDYRLNAEDNVKWGAVLYALENKYEFLSNAFSSATTINYLNGIKTSSRLTLYGKFVEFVKSVLGMQGKDSTLLEQVVAGTNRLTENNRNAVFRYEDVVSGVLMNKGYDSAQITGRADFIEGILSSYRGLGIPIDPTSIPKNVLKQALTHFDYAIETQRASTYEERRTDSGLNVFFNKASNDTSKTILDQWRSLSTNKSLQGFRLDEESIQNGGAIQMFKGWLPDVLATASHSDLELFLTTAPKSITDYIFAVKDYVKSFGEVERTITRMAQNGLVDEAPNDAFTKAYGPLRNTVAKLNEVQLDLQEAEAKVQALQQITQQGFRSMRVEADTNPMARVLRSGPREPIRDAAEEMGIAKGKSQGLISRYFEHVGSIAERFPVVRPVTDAIFGHTESLHHYLTDLFGAHATRVGDGGILDLSKEAVEKNQAARKDLVVNEFTNRVLLNQQALEDKATGAIAPFDPNTKDPKWADTKEAYWKLSPEVRENVDNMLRIQASEIKSAQKLSMETLTTVTKDGLARVILSMRPDYDVKSASTIVDALHSGAQLMLDPKTAVQGQELIRTVSSRLQPDDFTRAYQIAVRDVERLNERQQLYNLRPGFASEVRFGKYIVRYKEAGEKKLKTSPGFADEREKADWLSKAQKRSGFEVVQEIDKQKIGRETYGLPGVDLEAYTSFVERQLADLRAMGVDSDVIAQIESNRPDEALKREMAAQDLGAGAVERKLAPGREDIPMLENHDRYLRAVAAVAAKQTLRSRFELAMADPSMRAESDLSKEMRQHLENYLHPDTEIGRTINSANFLYYMGFRLSTGVMELGQSMFTHAAGLTSKGATIPGSYKLLWKASKEIAKWAISGKWSNPSHEAVMNAANAEGLIRFGHFDDILIDPESEALFNSHLLSQNRPPTSAKEYAQTAIGNLSVLARNLYGISTHFNARLALLSAYDHFVDQGMSHESAYNEAKQFNRSVNFAGGRAGRPIGLFSAEGDLGRTAATSIYSLQSYNWGTVAMVGRFIREGFGKSNGLTPAQVKNAKNAAVQLLGTQLLAAGALGLPGVGVSMAILQQVFPDLEIEKMAREGIASLAGQDKELGSVFTDVAMRGAINQFVPFDISSRLAMGTNFLGASNYDGFSVANIVGPTYSLVSDVLKGSAKVASGDVGAGLQQALPASLKGVIRAYQGDIQTPNGQLLLQPTMGEQFSMLIGFNPTRAKNLQDAKRIENRSMDIQRRQERQFNESVAEHLQSGDSEGAKQILLERTKNDPGYDPRAGGRAAAQVVENRTLPQDPRRTGTRSGANSQTNLLSTFQLPQQSPSETQRLQIRKQIEAKIGLPGLGVISPTELRSAQLVDQLMLEEPSLTLAGARSRVDQLLYPSRYGSHGTP